MTIWDVMTWVAIAVLGPGALIIFAAFLRDLIRPPARDRGQETPPDDPVG
jgi:hypothetical protein